MNLGILYEHKNDIRSKNCDSTNLKLKADEHGQEDKAKADNTDRKANQPSEHPPPPRWVIKLLTARHWTAPLHTLGEKKIDPGRRRIKEWLKLQLYLHNFTLS